MPPQQKCHSEVVSGLVLGRDSEIMSFLVFWLLKCCKSLAKMSTY